MDPKQILEQGESMINELKYEEGLALLLQNEGKIQLQEQLKDQLYLNIGICCFRLQQFKSAIKYLDNINTKTTATTQYIQAVKFYFTSLIYDQQHERCMKESQIQLKQTDDGLLLGCIYQCRGQCLSEQCLFLAAIEEYKKAILNGNKSQVDIAYCYLQMDELQETENCINQFTEQEQNDIQALLIKSDFYTRTDQEKQGAESLILAYQYYKSKQFGQTDYSPKELEYFNSKLGEKNASYINSFYKRTRKSNLNNNEKNVFQQFIKEMNNKGQIDISKEISDQLSKLLPKTFISSMKAERDIEQLLEDSKIKDYYDGFIQCTEQAFNRASGFVNGFQMRTDDKLISFGISLLSMVPLIGQTVSTVANQLQSEIRSLQIFQRSTALVQVSNTCDELIIVMKQVLAIVLRNQQKQEEIHNPHLSKSFQSFLRDILNLETAIKRAIVAQIDDIYIKDKSQQQLLGIKDASELLGTYFSSGYLSTFAQKDEENFSQWCGDFILADGAKKSELRKFATKKVSTLHDKEIIESKCCEIF